MAEFDIERDAILSSNNVDEDIKKRTFLLSQISSFLYFEYKIAMGLEEVKEFISSNGLEEYINYDSDTLESKTIEMIKNIFDKKQ